MTSTAWPGPSGDAWDAAAAGLQSWADSIDWAAYVRAESAYLGWAYDALARITAHANELSAAQLAALETDRRAHPDYPPGKPKTWSPRYDACKLVERTSVAIVNATQANLADLQSLGIAARDAGVAVVAQGLLRDADTADYLAGPWIRQGHPFPRHPRVSWNDYPMAAESAFTRSV
jgi:hypothetical protein